MVHPKKVNQLCKHSAIRGNYTQHDLTVQVLLNAILLLIQLDSLNIFYYNCASLLPFMDGSAYTARTTVVQYQPWNASISEYQIDDYYVLFFFTKSLMAEYSS